MGRQANALDWTERTELESGVGLRALCVPVSQRSGSGLRLKRPAEEDAIVEEEPPTLRFARPSCIEPRETLEPLSARAIVRLSALADWIEGAAPSGAVVRLVRAFLRDLEDVGFALDALVAADAGTEPFQALTQAVGMWRTNMVEYVDDLALGNYLSFAGWSSLPEYSSAYTLAIVHPALAEAEAWAVATRGEQADLVLRVRAVGSSVERLNATLREAIERSSGEPRRPMSEAPLRANAGGWQGW